MISGGGVSAGTVVISSQPQKPGSSGPPHESNASLARRRAFEFGSAQQHGPFFSNTIDVNFPRIGSLQQSPHPASQPTVERTIASTAATRTSADESSKAANNPSSMRGSPTQPSDANTAIALIFAALAAFA